MKLYNNQNKIITYKHNDEEINIPEYVYKDEDIRGCWIASVSNMDIPICQDIKEYQNYLISILDNMQSYNMNTAVFQVRPCNDAYYPSKLNPWSKYITGVQGQDPGFDVLEFFIQEAKKRGIKVHAWMNPYRVDIVDVRTVNMTKDEYLDTLAPNNYARLHKEDTTLDGTNKVILKPSSKNVIKFVTDTIMEVVENYDVTGVHIDDYFYPYSKVPRELEEEDYQAALKENPGLEFDDWRRSNVDEMIESIHLAMKKSLSKSGKKVEFGISPFAIYRTNKALKETGWEKGSFHSAGVTECYSDLYSDIYKWMEKGWIDYVVPQLYFPFERKDVKVLMESNYYTEIELPAGVELDMEVKIIEEDAGLNPLEMLGVF